MKRTPSDTKQLTLYDLFELPRPINPTPSSLDHGKEIRHLLSAALKQTSKSRYEVCSRMSELIGTDISVAMLNAWTAESREAWRFPLEYAPAFEVACETFCITEFLARKRGCKVYAGDEVRQAEIGRLESQMQELSTKLKALKKARILD